MSTLTVTELVLNFAEACRALVPSMDRAGVPWRDAEQYDNWDRIAEPLFESLVTEPCAFQAVGEAGLNKLRPLRYGFLPASDCNAWIAMQGNPSARLISLLSVASPFDHVVCEEPVGVIPIHNARLAFVYDTGDGTRQLDDVNLQAE